MNRDLTIQYKDQREVFRVHQDGDVIWLSAAAFDRLPGIRLAIATRFGGVSEGIYASMNLSVSQGDDPEKVTENFIRLGKAVGIPAEEMVVSQQTHTTNLRYCTREDCGRGVLRPRGYTDVDGLYTDQTGVGLVISFADCVPVFLADPGRRAVAASHSGWRGTVGKIGSITVRQLQEQFGCDPSDLYALIGPSICADCYEVDEPVISKVREAYDQKYWNRLFTQTAKQKSTGHYQFDLWEANRINLLEAGVPDEQITVTNLCTCCNPQLIFSHRASHGQRGVTVGMIEMV